MAVPVLSRIQDAHQMALPVPSVPSLVQASHQMTLSVPYGFTFSPEDHELIYILYRKVNGNSLPVDEDLIEERDLFGKEEPWEIFGRGTEKTRYFFVKLKKKGKSADGSNFVRTVGKGTWKGQDGQIPIKDQQGRTIGFKKNLVYKGKGSNNNGRWLMKEYHLHGVSLQPLPKLNDYVLCRIRKKDDGKKQNVSKRTEEAIGGNQDGEVFGSVSCAENSIIGRKRPRPNLSVADAADAAMPNLSAADAPIMVELIAQKEPRIDKEGDQRMDRLGFGTEEAIGGNQDGEAFGSVSCAENPIIGRKRLRPNLSVADVAMPNLSVADAPIMVESIAQEEPRIDKEGDQRMDRLGAENCVPALSEGISKSFTQDDYAEIFGGLCPIIEKFSDEDFGGRLWTESEAEQMGDISQFLQDFEINSDMFC
ncbi:NAC domain-containing protein [Actinidia chinensis var. chinensis]|uniref:NAC domain-containing protein n=1 Tax=Actinidia chinensis var. chinensis TaxID=1590841 RepID=A0A2R6PVU0_ACTCC|nr:NAC domain-containing protein [Actinidia chinensis var. chinensis]